MQISFASPAGALVAAAVALPLLALVVTERRGSRVRQVLGLAAPGGRPFVAPLAALTLVAALLGLAAAQPLLANTETRYVRGDIQVYLVVDTSRSMLAASSADGTSRFERAKSAAQVIRDGLRDVPVGIGSLTDRLLPHLFPTTDDTAFATTLRRSIGIELPPPRALGRHATSFAALADAAIWNFFSPSVQRRILIVLTDGEGRRSDPGLFRQGLVDQRPIRVAFVHVWRPDERVYGPNGPEPTYRVNPASKELLRRVAAVTHGRVFEEGERASVAAWVEQQTTRHTRAATTMPAPPHRLAPFALGAAFLPLSFLVWRRNRA